MDSTNKKVFLLEIFTISSEKYRFLKAIKTYYYLKVVKTLLSNV